MWWLRPQKRREKFIGWRHITRQQSLIVEAVQDAIRWVGQNKISIASWHGIGKSSILAMLIIWFLFCYKDAQIPCTAPTQSQMYDVLRKELAKWLRMMPKELQNLFDHTGDYLRVKERHQTWFARAKTGKKENAEALAWVHSDFVMLVADEASWVPDEIYESSKGALTNPTVLFIMISNPTRLEWYFYRSHHELQHMFKILHFNSEESPIVDGRFVNDIVTEHWKDSDQYRIRVQGKFPREDAVDDKWYVPLLALSELRFTDQLPLADRMWIDPSGEWNDKTIILERDALIARVVSKKQTSTEKTIAADVSTWSYERNIAGDNIMIDNFWVGANVWVELALSWIKAKCVNVGDVSTNVIFANKRAECFWRMRERILKGWQLYWTIDERRDLLMIKYKRNLKGKIQIMSKDDMRKLYGKSPDVADALALTFWNDQVRTIKDKKKKRSFYDPVTWEIRRK